MYEMGNKCQPNSLEMWENVNSIPAMISVTELGCLNLCQGYSFVLCGCTCTGFGEHLPVEAPATPDDGNSGTRPDSPEDHEQTWAPAIPDRG